MILPRVTFLPHVEIYIHFHDNFDPFYIQGSDISNSKLCSRRVSLTLLPTVYSYSNMQFSTASSIRRASRGRPRKCTLVISAFAASAHPWQGGCGLDTKYQSGTSDELSNHRCLLPFVSGLQIFNTERTKNLDDKHRYWRFGGR